MKRSGALDEIGFHPDILVERVSRYLNNSASDDGLLSNEYIIEV